LVHPLDSHAVQALRESVDNDDEFLRELVETFLEDSPGQLAELRAAADAGDAGAVRRVAHTLKSNGATFGVVRLEQVCRELELRASGGDLEGANELIGEIDKALAEARPELQALSADGAS
jgi:HPt (histidine-containing phosphotransfer) domain-containing protein